jgi:hypothetical protein
MSHKTGATAFFTMLDTLKLYLLEDPNINTCTYGDLAQIDLAKQTIFPLAHLVPNNARVGDNGQTITFNITIILMDIVDISKEKKQDIFYGVTNEQYILNTMLAIGNRLFGRFKGGDLRTDGYIAEGSLNCEPFYQRFENQLAGWACTFDLTFQNDIYIC